MPIRRVFPLFCLVATVNAQLYAIGGRQVPVAGGGISLGSNLNVEACPDYVENLQPHVMPPYPLKISFAGAAVLRGEIYVAGGYDSTTGAVTDRVYKYTCSGWVQMPSLRTARAGHGLVAVGNALYAVGGTDGSAPLRSVERYSSGTWQVAANLNTARSNFGIAVLGSTIYAIGGASAMTTDMLTRVSSATCGPLGTVEQLDTAGGGGWTAGVSLNTPRCRLAAATLNGQIFAIYGLGADTGFQPLNSTEIFSGGSWSQSVVATSSTVPRSDHAAVSYTDWMDPGRNTIIMLGGARSVPPYATTDVFSWSGAWVVARDDNDAATWTDRSGVAVAVMQWDCALLGRDCGSCLGNCPDPYDFGNENLVNVVCGSHGGSCNASAFCDNGVGVCYPLTTGSTGSTGTSGSSGTSGSTGTFGSTGSTGTTSTGTSGTTGSSGSTGSTGTSLQFIIVQPPAQHNVAPAQTGDANAPLIGGLVGGIGGPLLLVAAVVIVVVMLRRRRRLTLGGGRRSDPSAVPLVPEVKSISSFGTWEIAYNSLELNKELGAGAFGVAYKAKWRGTECVVKTSQVNDDRARAAFIKELSAMQALRPHPNCVQLLGVCLDLSLGPLALVLEWVDGGSLDALLNKIDMNGEIALGLCTDIAAGMRHLHDENILHCDLSARNVLISHRSGRYTAKIADFGLAHVAGDGSGIYASRAELKLPIRWTAPEILNNQFQQSKAGDVWSMGVVVWEILENKIPYPHLATNYAVLQAVSAGERLYKPKRFPYNPALDEVMDGCFDLDAAKRPTFLAIHDILSKAHDLAKSIDMDDEDTYLDRSVKPEPGYSPWQDDGTPSGDGNRPEGDGAPTSSDSFYAASPAPSANPSMAVLPKHHKPLQKAGDNGGDHLYSSSPSFPPVEPHYGMSPSSSQSALGTPQPMDKDAYEISPTFDIAPRTAPDGSAAPAAVASAPPQAHSNRIYEATPSADATTNPQAGVYETTPPLSPAEPNAAAAASVYEATPASEPRPASPRKARKAASARATASLSDANAYEATPAMRPAAPPVSESTYSLSPPTSPPVARQPTPVAAAPQTQPRKEKKEKDKKSAHRSGSNSSVSAATLGENQYSITPGSSPPASMGNYPTGS